MGVLAEAASVGIGSGLTLGEDAVDAPGGRSISTTFAHRRHSVARRLLVLIVLVIGLCLFLPTGAAMASPPANDSFENALTLQEGQLAVSAENVEATKEVGEPNHRGDPGGASVWFKWTAPRSGGVFLQACGEGNKFVVAAYTGDAVNSLIEAPPIEAWGNCQYAFFATAGTTYRIAVDGKYDSVSGEPATGDPDLWLQMVPPNDDFEKAADLGSWKEFVAFGWGSIGATKQPGEPEHGGNRGGSSVWFTWTAPFSGSVQVNVCSATFHALVGAYLGSALPNLTTLASGDNAQSPSCPSAEEGHSGQIAFNIDAGTVYRLAVDGYEGQSGKFAIGMVASTERLKPPAVISGSSVPDTRIARRHIRRRRGVARFWLASSEKSASFQCRLDGAPFVQCGPVVRLKKLKPGHHQFQARAVNAMGVVDPAPAVFSFTVRRLKASR